MTANSGAKTLEMMVMSKAREPVDMVIADLVMPQMSGRKLTELMRAVSPDIPISYTRGYLRPGRHASQELHLQKPFTSQKLLRRVKQVL